MKRSSAIKRRSPLKRGGFLQRRRRKPAAAIAAVWREGLHLERCVVCGTGRDIDGHHVIPRRVLVWHHLDAYLADRRNRVAVCREDHESHECAHRRIRRDELPAPVIEFALEVGLLWYLDRHYPARVAA